MNIYHATTNRQQLQMFRYLTECVGDEHTKIVISKFIEGGREIEMDGVAKDGVIKVHPLRNAKTWMKRNIF